MFNDAIVKLGGNEWEIRFRTRATMPVKRTWGITYAKTRHIYIRKDLHPRNVLDTLIHEMRHCQHEVLFEAESYVNWTSTELANGLSAVGILEQRSESGGKKENSG